MPTMATAAATPMSKSAPGTILKRLMPDPVSRPKTMSSGTVVAMLTICERATAAAIELPSTC